MYIIYWKPGHYKLTQTMGMSYRALQICPKAFPCNYSVWLVPGTIDQEPLLPYVQFVGRQKRL